MKKRTFSEDTTIYNYTLIRKVSARPLYTLLLSAGLPIFLLAFLFRYGVSGLGPFIVSLVGIPFLHIGFTQLYLAFTKAFHGIRWTMRWSLPWPGYLPEGFVPSAPYFRLTHQLALIGFAGISLFYFWLPRGYYAALMLMHLWILLPRYAALRQFRNLKIGMLRLNDKDISFYRS